MAGWLDNYNDSKASAPEGFQGDGYSNVGRNYSPAWGGQFQEGGIIPIAQEGTQTISSKDKRGIDLLIKETEKAKKDKNELQSTGKIKNPRSIAYSSKVKKQPELKQDRRTDYEREYDDKKGKSKELKRKVIGTADELTDLMQIGNFIPHPYAQTVGEAGNILGAGIDAYQAAEDFSEGDYESAAINAGSAILPMFLERSGYTRDMYNTNPNSLANKIASFGNRSGSYIPLTTLPNAIAPSTIKGVNFNRALLGTLGAEATYDIPDYQMGGSVYPVNYVPQAQNGKLTFLQPTSDKLPEGYVIPYDTPSSERAMSIGGEDGEPAYLIPSFKYGRPLNDPIGEFKKTGEHLGGPFKTWQEAEQWEKDVRHPAVEKKETIMFPQEKFAMGGSLPGATGHMYARVGAPSNGPYAKKTKASAKYGGWLDSYEKGGIIKDDLGQWAHPGEITEINSNDITMEGVPYNVLGISDIGDVKLMKPGKNYKFKGKKVTEYPMAKNGVNQADENSLVKLDQLTNFTNYNTKQPGGWLDTL